MIFLVTFLFCSIIASSSDEVVSWKENFWVKRGRPHHAYQGQVFRSKWPSLSPAAAHCDEISKNHQYNLNSDLYGYSISGYKFDQKDIDFSTFRDTFERYCYMPCDGMDSFYKRHPCLKKFLWHVPFLKVLVPYWMEGDIVQEVAADRLAAWLPQDESPTCTRFPDILLNVLYSPHDRLVSRESAVVLYKQLKKTAQFPNVRLMRVDRVNGELVLVLEPEELTENALVAEAVKRNENRQWWLKHLWVSKVAVFLIIMAIFIKLAKPGQDAFHGFSQLIFALLRFCDNGKDFV